jgi:4-amino-4-deoxy-L-arabinose transferase and related glycosyltransferases of PMT family
MEWLDRGSYNWDAKHPPLGRVPTALALYLQGARSIGVPGQYVEGQYREGNALLAWKGEYRNNLTLARLGALPFFLAACLVIWAWTSWAFGRAAALIAVLLFSSTPPVLAHAGVAMTDIALAATLPAALFSFCLWMSRPAMARAILLGAALGLAILSKFTALAFFAAGALPLMFVAPRSPLRKFRTVVPAMIVTALTIWAGYRFSVTPLASAGPHLAVDSVTGASGFWHDAGYRVLETPLPGAAVMSGVYGLWLHNSEARHPNYFLGERSWSGWWFFYPVMLAVKTPAAFLILAAAGVVFIIKDRSWRQWTPVWPAVGILVVGLMSQINTGIRHILPIYVMLAAIAAFGAVRLLAGSRIRIGLCIALLTWHMVSSAAAHPDYLAYFNELAIGGAGNFGVDSDLDWGQDLWRLRDACAQRKVDSLWIAYNGSADLNRFGLPTWRELPPGAPRSGWIAISIYKLKLGAATEEAPESFDAYSWLEKFEPVSQVGKSMRLYYVP